VHGPITPHLATEKVHEGLRLARDRQKWQSIDRSQVSDLVTQFSARIRAVARLHRLAAHDVEDVMQTTWVRLLENGGSIRNAKAVGAWLETTARRESLRVLRKAGRELPTDRQLLEDEPAAPVDERRLAAVERRAAIAAALSELTGRQRDVLAILLVDPAPSYAEISRSLGMPVGSIGPTRARILERLRTSPHLTAVISDNPEPA
jgi:RNA polymerase sigma factor (sigma-70 family)